MLNLTKNYIYSVSITVSTCLCYVCFI